MLGLAPAAHGANRTGRVFTAAKDGSLKVWGGRGFDEQAVAGGKPSRVTDLAIDSTGRWSLVSHRDGALRLWELRL